MANDITVIRDYLTGDNNQTSSHSGEDGITIGRWDGGPEGKDQPCEIILNDPTISRVHAGVNQLDGQYYILNLTVGNVLRINNRWLKPEQVDILADGDVVQIGSYFMAVTRQSGNLSLRVFTQNQATDPRRSASMSGSMSASVAELIKQRQQAPAAGGPDPSLQGVINVFWDRRKKREKAARPSPLHPRAQARPGKVRWNWQPTRDLARPWPFSVFIWATVLIAAFAIFAAFKFVSAYSPAPLSSPHQRAQFTLTERGKIANKVNENSCLTCHTPLGRVTVDQKCAECHQADGFHQSNTKKHVDAGITCTTCHQEHQGESYQPKARSFDSCAECHNDNNQNLYGPNKEQVSTPHKATYGYPVKNGEWVWMGLDKEVLALKPDVVQILDRYIKSQNGGKPLTRQQELNWQFHYIHLERVKPVPGIEGLKDGALSCLSCHKTVYPVLDRNYPIDVCAKCHNGYYDGTVKKQWVDEGKPNCTSCHVQHYYDKYRWGDLLVDKARTGRQESMDDKTVESIVKPQ